MAQAVLLVEALVFFQSLCLPEIVMLVLMLVLLVVVVVVVVVVVLLLLLLMMSVMMKVHAKRLRQQFVGPHTTSSTDSSQARARHSRFPVWK